MNALIICFHFLIFVLLLNWIENSENLNLSCPVSQCFNGMVNHFWPHIFLLNWASWPWQRLEKWLWTLWAYSLWSIFFKNPNWMLPFSLDDLTAECWLVLTKEKFINKTSLILAVFWHILVQFYSLNVQKYQSLEA